MLRRLLDPKKFRYSLVGIVSTAIDFGLLIGLVGLGWGRVSANFVSTTAGFLISYSGNKRYTFKVAGDSRRFIRYVVVTLVGIWVIQPIILIVAEPVSLRLFSSGVALVLDKLLATGVTFVWNYLLYSRLVFRNGQPRE